MYLSLIFGLLARACVSADTPEEPLWRPPPVCARFVGESGMMSRKVFGLIGLCLVGGVVAPWRVPITPDTPPASRPCRHVFDADACQSRCDVLERARACQ